MKKLLFIFLIPIFSFTQNGDTNGDGFTNLEDLFNVLENWLQNVNDNDPEAISNLDEMTNLVDSLITLNQNINYGMSIDGWVEHDFQITQDLENPFVNEASSSGILQIRMGAGSSGGFQPGYPGTDCLSLAVFINDNFTYNYLYEVDGEDVATIPLKIGDQIILFSEECEITEIYFFSFGDSNVSNNNQSNSNNSSLISTNYLEDYSGISCDDLDNLSVGTIVNDVINDNHYVVTNGMKCGSQGEGMFIPSGNPNNDASSTAYYLSRRNVLYCFTVNDTIAFTQPTSPSITSCFPGTSYLYRLSQVYDDYNNFDPNTEYETSSAGSVLLPGVLYIWEHGNLNCGSTFSNFVAVSPNLSNQTLFNQVSIWTLPYGESNWYSANYVTNNQGLIFYEFGKYLKLIN
tara:strand:- start:96 stop:1304 length:1209 start_codon:yes stop_codon:yes gene_type:complete